MLRGGVESDFFVPKVGSDTASGELLEPQLVLLFTVNPHGELLVFPTLEERKNIVCRSDAEVFVLNVAITRR